jgi:hypothetical protein
MNSSRDVVDFKYTDGKASEAKKPDDTSPTEVSASFSSSFTDRRRSRRVGWPLR